jgi:hypothetical protein
MRARSTTLFALVIALGCGSGGEAPSARSRLPPSDRDPLPFTPAPAPAGRTDEPVALAAAGGEDQARRMLPALLAAARDGDQRALEQLLADEITNVQTPDVAPRPREVVVERVLLFARRALIQPDVRVEELVDLTNARASRAAQSFEGREVPRELRPTDVVLEVPLLEAGRAPLRSMLGWHLRGTIVVRPGRDPRIVGL